MMPGAHERLLGNIRSLIRITDQEIGKAVDLFLVRQDQRLPGGCVSAFNALDESYFIQSGISGTIHFELDTPPGDE
jgi:hypothetical protein